MYIITIFLWTQGLLEIILQPIITLAAIFTIIALPYALLTNLFRPAPHKNNTTGDYTE
jgi:hypothetical protein